jgi:PAS domain S-box-containing protein
MMAMTDAGKTTHELLEELTELHRRIDELTAEGVRLAKNEERYRSFVNNIEDGCFETDLDGNVTFSNEACSRIYGFSPEDFQRLNFRTYTKPEEAEKVFAVYHRVYKTGEPAKTYYHEFTSGKGDVRIVEGSVALIRNPQGKAVGFRGIVRDATARKRWEAELERYRNFVENVEDGCYEYDLKGHCIFCNEGMARMNGYTREEYIKLNMVERHGSEAEANQAFELHNRVYRTGLPVKRYTINGIHKNGTIRTFEASVSLIRNEKGEPIGFRGIAHDITDQKRMEDEQRRLREELFQAQKMEAIGTLAGGIAHDFNNLLMGIQGHVSLMLLELGPSHPFNERLKMIESQVQSGGNLTRQLLGFARGGRYEVKPTNLNELVENAISVFGRTKKEVAIQRRFAPDLKNVEVDRGQIEQVLLNLFVNAWHAMPMGGTLTLETKNVVLDEFYVKPHNVQVGPYVKLSVTDTGIGMDETVRERIFEPFFTTKEMGRGTGLGLASAYGIIKGHKGMITVYSEKGHGTTFNIYLPASDQDEIRTERPVHKVSRGRETILVVDDEKTITDVTADMLAGLGYQALTAGSGEEAVEIYRSKSETIHLVIMDMIMPGMSGGETFDRIKAMNPGVKVILSSGYSLNGNARVIMDRGVRAFLQKPFLLGELAEKVRDVLDES